jgi:hypothetical protein
MCLERNFFLTHHKSPHCPAIHSCAAEHNYEASLSERGLHKGKMIYLFFFFFAIQFTSYTPQRTTFVVNPVCRSNFLAHWFAIS